MKKEEIIKKYGKSKAKKIIKKMDGQTVGIADDGSDDFYEQDVIQANKDTDLGN
jgi:hypothetical protein